MKLKIYFNEYLIKLNGISVILLLIFGVFLVSSATAVESQRIYSDSFYMIANHGLGILIGVGMFLLIKRFNYLYFFKFLTPLVLVMIGALFVLPTMGVNLFGSTRWLDIGNIRIQPSELAKPIIILWVARQLSNEKIKEHDLKTCIILQSGVLKYKSVIEYLGVFVTDIASLKNNVKLYVD